MQLIWGCDTCDTTCSVNRKGTRPTLNWLHIIIGMLSNLETFHEYNLDDSVDGARSYAMLSYGKKGRDVDTSYELRYNMAITTNKSATMLPPTEDACPLCQIVYFDLVQGPRPNQELIEAVGHSCSACNNGLITPTMHNLLPLRSET